MYLIEWESGSDRLENWEAVTRHPLFLVSSVYFWEFGLGWVSV